MSMTALARTAAGVAARRAACVAVVAVAALCGTAVPASAGNDVVDVHVQCVWPNTDGSTTAVWSYTNHSASAVDIPVGTDNRMTTGAADQGQPTHFLPGENLNAWVVTFSSSSLAWHVLTNGDTANNGSPHCLTNPVSVVGDWRAGAVVLGLLVPAAAYAVRRGRLPWPSARDWRGAR